MALAVLLVAQQAMLIGSYTPSPRLFQLTHTLAPAIGERGQSKAIPFMGCDYETNIGLVVEQLVTLLDALHYELQQMEVTDADWSPIETRC